MKRISAKILSVLLALTTILSVSVCGAGAISYSNDVDTKSKAILLVSMDTGQTVLEQNADEKMYPASTTKIMSYIIAYENINDIMNARIEIKQSVIDLLLNTGSSMAYLSDHIGQKVSGKDLLYSMMVPSGNDAALVLADYVGNGDIQVFVDKMNAKAAELGCKNTHFANPDGLHDPNHYTTARDLKLITDYALDLPYFKEITNTVRYTCEGDDTPLVTTNGLLDGNTKYYYVYAQGIKTGTTDEAGRCLVTTASADGQTYMLILLGAPYQEGVQEEYYTFIDAKALFQWCLVDLELATVYTTETPVSEVKVENAGKKNVTLVPEHNVTAVLPVDRKPENIEYEVNAPDTLQAPVKSDEVVGTVTVYYKDDKTGRQELATVNLLPAESIDSSVLQTVSDTFGKILKSYWFLFVIGIIVLVVIIYIIAAKIHRYRKKKKREVKRYRNF